MMSQLEERIFDSPQYDFYRYGEQTFEYVQLLSSDTLNGLRDFSRGKREEDYELQYSPNLDNCSMATFAQIVSRNQEEELRWFELKHMLGLKSTILGVNEIISTVGDPLFNSSEAYDLSMKLGPEGQSQIIIHKIHFIYSFQTPNSSHWN